MKGAIVSILPALLACSILNRVDAQDYHHLEERHSPPTFASLEHWLGRAAWLREHILVSTGLSPLPETYEADAILSGLLERDGYTVQSIVLETYPGFYLTGNLYRPSGGSIPHPAILSAHGHWDAGRFEDSETASVPGRAITFARQGYVVLTYSMIGYNEAEDLVPHRFDRPKYQLWGFSAMGLQLWNSRRALDFLSALPDVDPARIGMTGASGGATQTLMLTAIDERIRVAAPVNMISAHFQGGCVCENAPSLRLDATNMEIGALAAPRPLIMVSTSGDWTVNTPDVEYPAIRAVYQLFNAEDKVANVHLDYPHNYNRDSREAVYAWFNERLLGQPGPVAEPPFEIDVPERLSARLPAPPASIEQLFLQFIRMANRQIERAAPGSWSEIQAYRQKFGPALRHALHHPEAQPPRAGSLSFLPPEGRTEGGPAALIIIDPEDDVASFDALIGSYTRRDVQVAVYRLPAGNELPPPPDAVEHWTTYNAVPAARAIASIRKAAEVVLERPDVTSLELVAPGKAGPFTLMARALVPTITRTSVDFGQLAFDSDRAFLESLPIPIVRRAGDFRTAVVMIAPSELSVHNLPEGSLRDWMSRVYRAAGAEDMLTMAP